MAEYGVYHVMTKEMMEMAMPHALAFSIRKQADDYGPDFAIYVHPDVKVPDEVKALGLPVITEPGLRYAAIMGDSNYIPLMLVATGQAVAY